MFCHKKRLQKISLICVDLRHFLFPLKKNRLAAVAGKSPLWAHICMTEKIRKRRSQVTYELGTASSGGQSNEAAARKSLRYAAAKLVETREEVLRKDALEEMFVTSRKRFLTIAYSILRNREDAEDAVQQAFLSAYVHVRSFEGRSALRTWLTRIVLTAALMMQ